MERALTGNDTSPCRVARTRGGTPSRRSPPPHPGGHLSTQNVPL